MAYNILKPITLPGNTAKIILQHHERLNGSGYPQGLKGEEILLEARILGVADVMEAMCSHRPYRASLGLAETLDELTRNQRDSLRCGRRGNLPETLWVLLVS